MNNIKSLCSQLAQSCIPLYADEKVYSIAKIIQLHRPEEFKYIILCLGTFHTVKNLLKCCSQSIEGSGAEHVWLESNLCIWAVCHKKLYYSCLFILAESIQRLILFKNIDMKVYSKTCEILVTLHSETKFENHESVLKKLLDDFKACSSEFINDLDNFIEQKGQEN